MLKNRLGLLLLTAAILIGVGAGVHAAVGLSPTGTGFFHFTGGAPDPTARAVNLASSDVTGTIGTANLPNGTPDWTGPITANVIGNVTGTGVNSATSDGGIVTVAPTEVVLANGLNYPVRVFVGQVTTTDNSTWQTIFSWTPSALGRTYAWYLDCNLSDMSNDAGTNPTGDGVEANFQFFSTYNAAKGWQFTSQAGLNGPAYTVPLAPLNVSGVFDSGPVNTTLAGAQVTVVDAGGAPSADTTMLVQIHGPSTDTYHVDCVGEQIERKN